MHIFHTHTHTLTHAKHGYAIIIVFGFGLCTLYTNILLNIEQFRIGISYSATRGNRVVFIVRWLPLIMVKRDQGRERVSESDFSIEWVYVNGKILPTWIDFALHILNLTNKHFKFYKVLHITLRGNFSFPERICSLQQLFLSFESQSTTESSRVDDYLNKRKGLT